MTDRDELEASSGESLEVGRRMAEAVRRALADDVWARDFLDPIDDAERECSALVGTRQGRVEVARRAAESRILVASLRDGITIERMESFRDALRVLGYTDLTREASMEILFARSCIAHGRIEHAASVLQEVLRKLDVALGKANASPEEIDSYLHDKAIVEQILANLATEGGRSGT